LKALKKIYVEITSVCNLACSFCPPTERKAQFVETADFRRILTQIKPFTDHIYLHVKGEPLLHPRLGQLLDISHELGFRANLTTNGTLIGKAGQVLLEKPALRQVNISLHSMEEHRDKTEEYQAGYVRSVLSFAREAVQRRGAYISLRLWNIAQATAAEEAEPQARRNRKLLEIMEQEFSLPYRIEEKVVPGSGIKLADRIYLNQDFQFDWPSLSAPEDDGVGFCHALRTHSAILADGTVVPCCLDGEGVIRLGNVHTDDFGSIIQGERARRLYDGFSRKTAVEELCRKCGYRKRFGGSAEEQGGLF
jgi:radical SAM protein with 4Fe4S-binding SPASM domain